MVVMCNSVVPGGCPSSGILDKHCGTKLKRWELTGSEYLIHFHTDSSVHQTGFKMDVFLGMLSLHVLLRYMLIQPILTEYPPPHTHTHLPPHHYIFVESSFHSILGMSGYLIKKNISREKWLNCLQKSEDRDEIPHSAASDLGPHCLPITRLGVS